MYGNLKVYTGSMFSGKTSALLKDVIWHKYKGDNVVLFKPAFDKRYALEKVTTHNGLTAEARNINSIDRIGMGWSHYFFDEIQFFTEEQKFEGDIISSIQSLLKASKDVTVCGLDMDWKGKPFRITTDLLAMADEVIKLKAICSVSGLPAGKTYKKVDFRYNDGSVELGEADIYEARCNTHWS